MSDLLSCHVGWQSLAPSSAVADYLSHLPASTLPLSLHHFLKYSAESIKKESQNQLSVHIYPYLYYIWSCAHEQKTRVFLQFSTLSSSKCWLYKGLFHNIETCQPLFIGIGVVLNGENTINSLFEFFNFCDSILVIFSIFPDWSWSCRKIPVFNI